MKYQFFLLALISTIEMVSQNIITPELSNDYWDIEAKNHKFLEYKGKTALYLEDGSARLKDSQFGTGIIEFDMAFEQGRKFLGIHFRIQERGNYEEFYIRPHQSGNPDAMQYTPVFNGLAGWQLYHGDGYSTAYDYNFNEWNHFRLVIGSDRMEVFINDMSQPILKVHDLKSDHQNGRLGIGTFMGGAHYANFSYQEREVEEMLSPAPELPALDKGTIKNWQVSSPLGEKSLDTVLNLKSITSKISEWKTLPIEYDGLVNLAKLSPVTEDTNTALAKFTIVSEKDQLKGLQFGYSDRARVYVNGKLIYSGQREFRSRDYRYLGTIGWFDALYLDLAKGENEVIIAVSESFGGWGLKARLENLEGVSIVSD